jgi:hypothetical protein
MRQDTSLNWSGSATAGMPFGVRVASEASTHRSRYGSGGANHESVRGRGDLAQSRGPGRVASRSSPAAPGMERCIVSHLACVSTLRPFASSGTSGSRQSDRVSGHALDTRRPCALGSGPQSRGLVGNERGIYIDLKLKAHGGRLEDDYGAASDFVAKTLQTPGLSVSLMRAHSEMKGCLSMDTSRLQQYR